MLKIVSPSEMKRIETLAFKEGASEQDFMQKAGQKVAQATVEFVKKQKVVKKAVLLVGKGNNGGDAYVAGIYLLENGYQVGAFHLTNIEESSPLNQLFCKKFQEKGGTVRVVQEAKEITFPKEGIILDGILGTGFKGELSALLQDVIQKSHKSCLPCIAIDIPSGVDGESGKVESVAICADVTVFLGLPKFGFFLDEGPNYTGDLFRGDFGLDEKFIKQAKEQAFLFEERDLKLPKIYKTRHKYQAGYVVAVAGSPGMSGAAKLSALATLRSGAGIVRLFYPKEIEEEMMSSPLEIIRSKLDFQNLSTLENEIKRAKSLFIGPGLGRKSSIEKFLKEFFQICTVPCVIDADALFFLSQYPKMKLPKNCILTPHKQEMMRLLQMTEAPEMKLFLDQCQQYAFDKDCCIVLKGAPSFVLCPGKKPVAIIQGDPGMATAGTGDVLTGVIAAFLAQGLSPSDAAMVGCYIHALAGRLAALEKTSYSLIASDVLEKLPKAFMLAEQEKHLS